ncbi:methyltransferase domain-containing protein [Bradyrhizobium diazoefficiens]|nr:class I SAM-dependent methyltransferase [Bradyrhizobium diazoefficiens]MBR0848971.1 methyltransferase domain-containing protein [Bradyrhizobium diazoefficiens]
MSTPARAEAGAVPCCRLCGNPLGGPGVALEQIPVCNRFTASKEPVERHQLHLEQCARCELIQLREALPVDKVMPQVPWIRYREPDRHLDAVVDRLLSGPCAGAGTCFGVGPFDQPLLDRLERRGLNALALETRPLASAENRKGFPYLETWQRGLDAPNLAKVAGANGTSDLVVCRYLLEHCHDPVGALIGLRQLLSADGALIIEVPDSAKFLAAGDYAFIWEEHVSYFVEGTLRLLAARAGYAVVELQRYPGELEDALLAVLRPSASEGGAGLSPTGAPQPDLFRRYASGLQHTRSFVRSWALAAAGPSRDGIALFGIGHQAVMFVHALGLSEFVAAAVDDDPDKRGYFPPGFHVAVVPSQALLADGRIRTCLLAVAPAIEHKVRDRLAPLAERGVQFHSIFAGVPGSLLSGLSSWR